VSSSSRRSLAGARRAVNVSFRERTLAAGASAWHEEPPEEPTMTATPTARTPSTDPVVVDVFTDIVCPWCLIGVEHLQRAMAAREDLTFTVRLHPFLLDPRTPDEGVDLIEHLSKKYGRDVRGMFASVEEAGTRSGIAFDFSGRPRSFPSLRAHALVAFAEQHGVGPAVHRALMEAYFVARKNIADREVLAQIGVAHGLLREDVLAVVDDERALAALRSRVKDASQQGITGVPFFIFDEKLAFSGAQPVDVFLEVLREVRAVQ
jgi:predicted DsbA family dithiol-disulfide isomerase